MISIYTLKCKLRSRDIVTDTGLLGILTKYAEFKSVINLEKNIIFMANNNKNVDHKKRQEIK